VELLLRSGAFAQVIGAFLEFTRESGGIKRQASIQADTLAGYAASAEKFVQATFDPTFNARDLNGENFVPVIGDIIANHRAWVPSERTKKEPFTLLMFKTLFDIVNAMRTSVGLEAAVFDWTVLGISTGSRISEYGQNKISKNHGFSAVPKPSPDAGMPIAFVRADFTFFDSNGIRQEHHLLLDYSLNFSTWSVHIRFRYDKSPKNYITRKFRALPGCPLCPVARVISIFRRAHTMGIPDPLPVGAYWNFQKGDFIYLTGSDVASVMRKVVIQAYPDENHYLRINIAGIVAHSCRVTAAVALRAAGLDIDTIATRLRWSRESVDTYLRECYQDIGSLTMSAVWGAFQISPNDPSTASEP
jgi:hypothetical protein